jgi:hypothetical protein
MSWTIIVASSDSDQLDELLIGAHEIKAQIRPPDDVAVIEATSVEEVMRERQRSLDARTQLLIVTASLPNSRSSPDLQGQAGVDLIKSFAREADPPARILVSDRLEHSSLVRGMTRCQWLSVNACTNYIEQCVQLARELGVVSGDLTSAWSDRRQTKESTLHKIPRVRSPSLGHAPIPESAPCRKSKTARRSSRQSEGGATYAVLEVELPSKVQFATIRLEVHKNGRIETEQPELLNLKQRAVNELIAASQKLKNKLSDALDDDDAWARYHKLWEAEYRALAKRVARLFWPTYFAVLYGRAYAEGDGNVRLRFNLERPLFDGLWEAIFDSLGQRFLLLDNTITRRARQPGVSESPDPDETSIHIGKRDLNVLVIRSDVKEGPDPEGPDDQLWREFWNGQKPLRELRHLADEVEELRALKRSSGQTADDDAPKPLVNVDVLRGPRRWGKPWSLADLVERKLKDPSRRYDIVHFAGHALFDDSSKSSDGRGYLVFSGYPAPHAVPVAKVASWLEKSQVQLVYLSCCRSSAAAAAVEFARKKVPMTIGFSWNLEDKKAVDFSKYFYHELLANNLKVCHAMRETRRKLFEEHDKGDPIWASPVLVAQPMHWIKVESVLRPQSLIRRAPSPVPRASHAPRPRSPIGGPSLPLHP